MPRATHLALAIALAVSFGARSAEADDDKCKIEKPTPKRRVLVYDGREPPPNGDNAGVWLGRVLLSPLYFVSEYVIRKPIDATMNFLEKHDRLTKIYDFFAFGPDHKIGFAPIGFVEFGFNPSIGIYGWWNDAFVFNNTLTMHVEFWPTDWLAATWRDRYVWGEGHAVSLAAVGSIRPDRVFYGIGPNSEQGNQSRFREVFTDVTAGIDTHVWRSSRVRAWGGYRQVTTSDGHFGGDPSLTREAATGAFPIPYGFGLTYQDPYGGFDFALDTRADVDPRSGLRLEVTGDVGTDLKHGSPGWVHYGGLAAGYWDIDGFRRILSLTAGASFIDPMGNNPIPFTELIMLGDDKWMTGYFDGRLRGQSAAVAMLRYDWPIASWIDATLQATVGNVFGEHLEGFSVGQLRFSGAVGITTTAEILASFAGAGNNLTRPRTSLTGPRVELVAGFGTDTFDRGATVQSFRLAFGVPTYF